MAEDDVNRLRAFLEAAKTPGDVVAACSAVESLCRQFPRSFLRSCFSVLLRRVFGFADVQGGGGSSTSGRLTSGGWLSLAAQPGNETVAGALITLLAPGSGLFRLLLSSDSDHVVRYVFPFERLPEWVRRLLAVERGAILLEYVSVVFKDRVKQDVTGSWLVELDVFQYYIFWFAYYAVCREPVERKGRGNICRSQLRSQFESWASAIPGLYATVQHASLVTPLHPYLQLLQLYLSSFVGPTLLRREKLGLAVWQEDTVGSCSDIIVRTLIDFWLVDDDPCPFPLSVCQTLQLRMLEPVPVYVPPGRELTDAVRLVINYFSAMLQTQPGNYEQLFVAPESPVAFRRKAGLLSNTRSIPPPLLLSTTTSPYLQSLQRPLYRLCLRGFCYWTIGTPLAKVLPIVDVWLHYLEPWSAVVLVPKEIAVQPGSTLLVEGMNHGYSAYWQSYVLANYLFYTSMVSHFLSFALKFLLLDMELVFQATCKVLTVLSKSSDLLELLRRVDLAYTDHFMGVQSALGDRIPIIQQQLQDWEEGVATPEEEHGEILRSNGLGQTPRLRLFEKGEYGGHHVLQTMIIHADAEIRACCADKPPMSTKTLDATKNLVKKIFRENDLDSPMSPVRRFPDLGNGDEASGSGIGLQKHSRASVKYKGDWMRRPIESQEIGCLVRVLVQLSDWLNSCLGLSQAGSDVEESQDNGEVRLCPVKLKPALRTLMTVWRVGIMELKKRGFRLNLRPLAHKLLLQFLVLIAFLHWLWGKLFL